jgi:hypothetical protein
MQDKVSGAHTPGPWSYEVEKVSGPSLSDATYLFAHGDVIGKAYESAGQGNAQANARLIAAAPELLEALRIAGEALCDLPLMDPRLVAIRAAIAKATGSAE